MTQNQWYHFGVGEFAIHFRTYFSGGDWDVHWDYDWILAHGQISTAPAFGDLPPLQPSPLEPPGLRRWTPPPSCRPASVFSVPFVSSPQSSRWKIKPFDYWSLLKLKTKTDEKQSNENNKNENKQTETKRQHILKGYILWWQLNKFLPRHLPSSAQTRSTHHSNCLPHVIPLESCPGQATSPTRRCASGLAPCFCFNCQRLVRFFLT